MEKTEIRAIARQLGLKTADKVDSQEICFVPGNDYKAFLRSHLGADEFHPGGICDKRGNRAGRARRHRAVHHRPAQGAARRQRRARCTSSISTRRRSSVIVGEAEDSITEEFEIDHAIWHGDAERAVRGRR